MLRFLLKIGDAAGLALQALYAKKVLIVSSGY